MKSVAESQRARWPPLGSMFLLALGAGRRRRNPPRWHHHAAAQSLTCGGWGHGGQQRCESRLQPLNRKNRAGCVQRALAAMPPAASPDLTLWHSRGQACGRGRPGRERAPHLHIHAGGQVQRHQAVDGLGGQVLDVNQPLVQAHLRGGRAQGAAAGQAGGSAARGAWQGGQQGGAAARQGARACHARLAQGGRGWLALRGRRRHEGAGRACAPAALLHAHRPLPASTHLELLARVLVHVGRAQHSVHLLAAAGAAGEGGQRRRMPHK